MADWINYPEMQFGASARARTDRRGFELWLWILAALVFAMVVVGGATRLTESGLSITEWNLVMGILPPLSHDQWLAAFDKYKQIPQFRELFPDMDLGRFQFIYAWEWSHRLLGRTLGLAIALPMAAFWLTGRIPPRLKPQLIGLLALVGLQGFVGWWMVSSGLAGRVEVAQERLATHLLLASLTLAWIVWMAAGLGEMRHGARRAIKAGGGLWALAALLVVSVFAQIGLGALVAGLRAGLDYNTWPLMDGHFVPPLADLMRLAPAWTNVTDNPTMVQFQHRMAAYALFVLALANAAAAVRSPGFGRAAALALLVACQASIGIATLLLAVPLWAGLLHQAFAMIVLMAAVFNLRRLTAA